MTELTILVVDDDRDFAESLADVLELGGHEITLANSGEQAIALFRENHFDITFMDVRMPGRNGVESFFEIQRLKPSARVIMMTGYSVPQLLEQAVENGAWDILRKPLDMQKVLQMTEKVKSCEILIADDDHDFLDSIQAVLVKEGYSVYVADDGEKALRQIQLQKVDALILDIRMPIISGLDTYMKMKQSGACIPTIIVTAYPVEEAETLSTLQSLDVYGVLRKPFDPHVLFDAINAIHGSAQAMVSSVKKDA